MNKKTYKILLLGCVAIFLVGLILVLNFETPFKVCRSWLSDPSTPLKHYNYAVENIVKNAVLYFGGMVLMVGGLVPAGIFTIGRYLKKKEPAPNEVVKNAID